MRGVLLPCPFCGGKPIEKEPCGHILKCNGCGIEKTNYQLDGAQWNQRYTTDKDVEKWANSNRMVIIPRQSVKRLFADGYWDDNMFKAAGFRE